MQFIRQYSKSPSWNIFASMVMLGIVLLSVTAEAVWRPISTASPGALRVQGTHIVDSQGHIITLVGASRFGLEFDCHGDRHYSLADFQAMRSWGMNAVRLTLSSAYWLNLQNSCPDYRSTVTNAIANAEKAGLYVMPVLQREAPFPISSEIQHGGVQYQMPDMNAISFWHDLATQYAHDPRIIFELFSEPHDVSWQVWRDGGTISTDHGTYQTPGMQALVKLINTDAPGHLVVAGGLVYAYDLAGITSGYALTGSNIVYATHPYDYSNKQPSDWWRAFIHLAMHVPVLATEFGEFDGQSHYVRQVIAQFAALRTGYFAWAWTAGTGNTDLLAPGKWNGTPSAYGTYIRDAMRNNVMRKW